MRFTCLCGCLPPPSVEILKGAVSNESSGAEDVSYIFYLFSRITVSQMVLSALCPSHLLSPISPVMLAMQDSLLVSYELNGTPDYSPGCT